ncbi:hypothetical protein [Campylobacter concisus]|uniref:hypothetical protein n=1 Tax=Campylobacter concisus TaxID=199 RepID=UPI00131B1385|nr:hypothetical protein [Campylobacter concisus]
MKLGEGLNKVTINDATMKGGSIENGNGGNEITLTNNAIFKESYIDTGDGKDIININSGSKVEGLDSGISTNAGEDEININNSTVEGEDEYNTIGIDTGDDTDMITIKDSNIKYTDIKTGNGDDVIRVYDGSSLNSTKIETGNGNDIAYLEHHSENYASDPDQSYSKPIASKTEINMGNGQDSLVLSGLGNSGNYAVNRVSDFDDVKINMGDGDHKHVQIHKAKVEKTTITTGSKDDLVQIQGDSLMEGRNSIYTGAGVDQVYIENSKLNGTATAKTTINTGADGDEVVIRNSTLTHAEILTDSGEDKVYIEDEVTLDGAINTGADNDEVNINTNITATTQANIKTGAGSDTVNIASGVTLTRTVIDMGAGEDTIELKGNSDTDRITFKGSTLYTDDAGYTANDIDHVTITNTTFMKSDDGRLSSVITGGGNDEITVKEGTVFQDSSFIVAGNGEDKIYLNSGSTFNSSRVYGDNAYDGTDGGNDEIYVNGAVFNGKNEHGSIHGGIYAGGGNDKIFVNSGTFNDAKIEGGIGDDFISIKQGVNLNNTTIDGGAGYDTLKIADDSVNLTKVTNIEKLDLTEGNHNINLSAKDVLDMTDSNNRLRIDGDSGDNLGLASKGWVEDTSANITGYKVYTNTEGTHTVTLEVKDEVHVF